MPRPVKLPEWATDGLNITEPTSGKKAEGWLSGEKPAAQYFNWWKELVFRWIEWLDALTELLKTQKTTLSVAAGKAGNVGWTYIPDPPKISSVAANDVWIIPASLPVGATVGRFRARVKSGGATSYVGARLFVFADDATVVSSAEIFSATDGTTAWQTIESAANPLSGHVMAAGQQAYVYLAARGAGTSARNATSVEVEWTHPVPA